MAYDLLNKISTHGPASRVLRQPRSDRLARRLQGCHPEEARSSRGPEKQIPIAVVSLFCNPARISKCGQSPEEEEPMKRLIGVLFIVAMLIATSTQALTIVESTAGGSSLAVNTYLGQSLATPTGPGWNQIQVNFFSPAGAPVAFGDLFLLGSEYLGAPADLNAATPGFLAESTGISGGEWIFADAVTLLPNTTYWFYSDALWVPGSMTGDGNVYAGGELYVNWPNGGAITSNFTKLGEDADFRVSGNPVPEPSTMLLLGSGLIGLAGYGRKKFFKK